MLNSYFMQVFFSHQFHKRITNLSLLKIIILSIPKSQKIISLKANNLFKFKTPALIMMHIKEYIERMRQEVYEIENSGKTIFAARATGRTYLLALSSRSPESDGKYRITPEELKILGENNQLAKAIKLHEMANDIVPLGSLKENERINLKDLEKLAKTGIILL